MTVRTSKPAVNLREELAALRNQGGYQEQQFWYETLVTNGGFDADTNWVKSTGWTISGGTANANIPSGYNPINQSLTLNAGVRYYLKFDVTTYTSGGMTPYLGNSGSSLAEIKLSGPAISSLTTATGVGTYTGSVIFDASQTQQILFRAAGSFIGSIDNVSLSTDYGVTWDSSNNQTYKMPKGWVPKDVFEDGLLQREGAANDYTVVYDGFDYYIKPAVAPSATTQTCVIGVKA